MLKRLLKLGGLFLVLVLLLGPAIQGHDLFNDAPNLDHDAALHSVDAVLCAAVVLGGLGALVFLLVRRWRATPFVFREYQPLLLPPLILRLVLPCGSPPLTLRI